MGEIEIGDYIVEWDDAKAEINKKKHGIRFEIAARIFLDENRIEDYRKSRRESPLHASLWGAKRPNREL